MTKSIIDIAREIVQIAHGWNSATFGWQDGPLDDGQANYEKAKAAHDAEFERRIVVVLERLKAAHLEELAGVEMPEPVAYKTDDIELYVKEKKNCAYSIPLVTLDQCQQAVATAVARKDAELETERLRLAACGVAALGYFEGCKDEYKSASLEDVLQLNKKVAALTAERDALREATKECVKALTVDASGKRLYPESRMKALVMVEALEATK